MQCDPKGRPDRKKICVWALDIQKIARWVVFLSGTKMMKASMQQYSAVGTCLQITVWPSRKEDVPQTDQHLSVMMEPFQCSATAVNQQYGRGGIRTPQIQSKHSMVMGFTHISFHLPKKDRKAPERDKSIQNTVRFVSESHS